MKRITKHGAHKPLDNQLLPYQEGYASSPHKFGLQKDGKELYINDGGEIRAVTDGYLHEEFINYAQPCDANGNIIDVDAENAITQYSKHTGNDQIYGLATSPLVNKTPMYDENGKLWAYRVAVKTRVIDTKNHEFQDQTYYMNSFDASYLEVIKNSVEQKGLYVVKNREEMYAKMAELSEAKTLEDGIQFIVQHDEGGLNIAEDDESGKGDTNLYVVSICSNPDEAHDGFDREHVYKAVAYKRTATEDSTGAVTPNAESKEGAGNVTYVAEEYYVCAKYVMHMNYQFHDPILANEDGDTPETNGLGLFIGAKDETANTIKIGLNKVTTNNIKEAIEDATTYDEKHFGTRVADGDLPTTVEDSLENKPVYTNYVKIHTKTLNEDGSTTKTTSFIDFNDFVLDEGTWD